MKIVLTNEDKAQIWINSNGKYNLLCKKLNSQEYHDGLVDSDSNESVMSEISIEAEIDCSSFAKSVDKPKRDLILVSLIKLFKMEMWIN